MDNGSHIQFVSSIQFLIDLVDEEFDMGPKYMFVSLEQLVCNILPFFLKWVSYMFKKPNHLDLDALRDELHCTAEVKRKRNRWISRMLSLCKFLLPFS